MKAVVAVVAIAAMLAGAALWLIPDPVAARAAALAAVCLVLWLSELVPPFAPTLLLLAGIPLLLGGYGATWQPAAVLRWGVDPVLALFLGGFALAAAAARHGLDRRAAGLIVRAAGSSPRALLAWVMGGVAALSLWMSNTAAAAMLLAALAPVVATMEDRQRRGILVGLALAASLGGMASPIGTGPNAIAIAHAPQGIGFIQWMGFAVPLAVLLIIATWAFIVWRFALPVGSPAPAIAKEPTRPITAGGRGVLLVGTAAIACWLAEPLIGVPAPVVSLALAAVLFTSGLLRGADLARIDWSTLLLIAGGLVLGRLLEHAGILAMLHDALHGAAMPLWALTAVLVLVAASLSAVMSNTATATMLIPLAATWDPSPPVLAVLIAIACSLGNPFIISAPPNAMVAAHGVRGRDLLLPGLVLMIGGCLLVAATGRWALTVFGL